MKKRTVVAVLAGVTFGAVALSFLLPAFRSVSLAFAPASVGTGVFPVGRLLSALRFTVTQALLSSVVAIVLGLPAAFLVARRNFPGRRFLMSLSGVPLCVPPVVIALAFVLFYGRQGYLNVFLMTVFNLSEPPITWLYSLAGVVIAHGFYNFPVVLRTVSQAWERLSEEEEQAAMLLGAGPFRIFRTITLPGLSSSILASGTLVFLYCFFSFVIVLLFGGIGGTTLEVELYQAARSTLDFPLAGTIALVETASAFFLVLLYGYFQGKVFSGAGASGSSLRMGRMRVSLRGFSEIAAGVSYLLFLLVFFIGPLLSILFRSFIGAGTGGYSSVFRISLDAWAQLFERRSFYLSLWNTITVGLTVALVSTVTAVFFAYVGRSWNRTRFGNRTGSVTQSLLFRVVPLSPLAVSSVMLGFGWTLLVPRGNVLVLILAQSAMAWPFAYAQIRSSLDRIPREIHDASALLSASPLDGYLRTELPLAARGVFSGAAFVFAISAGDASLPLVLTLERFENLSLSLYRLVGSYRFSEACACAVVLSMLCGFVFFAQDGKNGSTDGGIANG